MTLYCVLFIIYNWNIPFNVLLFMIPVSLCMHFALLEAILQVIFWCLLHHSVLLQTWSLEMKRSHTADDPVQEIYNRRHVLIDNVLCFGALLLWRIHELLFSNSDLFLLICSQVVVILALLCTWLINLTIRHPNTINTIGCGKHDHQLSHLVLSREFWHYCWVHFIHIPIFM